MFFSVIIPIYQSEKTIQKCLDSLQKQLFQDFEAILIDDGSTDHSGEICSTFASSDSRFHYVKKENGGPSSARNAGLDIANGKYVTFLDSDDCYKTTFLKGFHQLIQSNKGINHFWCEYETSHERSSNKNNDLTHSCSITVTDRSEIMTLHGKRLLASVWNKVFKNSIIQEYDIRMDEDISLGEDLLFNLHYLDNCSNSTIIVWNSKEYEYSCISNNSLNHKYRNDLERIYKILLCSLYNYLHKWNASDSQLIQYETMSFYMLERIIWNYEDKRCTLSSIEKLHAISRIIHSEEFNRALHKGQQTIHPIMKKVYETKNSLLVRTANEISILKNKGYKEHV